MRASASSVLAHTTTPFAGGETRRLDDHRQHRTREPRASRRGIGVAYRARGRHAGARHQRPSRTPSTSRSRPRPASGRRSGGPRAEPVDDARRQSGASGPTTVTSALLRAPASSSAATSVASTGTHRPTAAMPGFPGRRSGRAIGRRGRASRRARARARRRRRAGPSLRPAAHRLGEGIAGAVQHVADLVHRLLGLLLVVAACLGVILAQRSLGLAARGAGSRPRGSGRTRRSRPSAAARRRARCAKGASGRRCSGT